MVPVLSVQERQQLLKTLLVVLKENEKRVYQALATDLGKSMQESFLTEFSYVCSEISYYIWHLPKLSRRRRVRTPFFLFPSRSYVEYEPFGRVLVISPWNYPFQLSLVPMVDAIAAGNSVVLKPSPKSPATTALLSSIFADSRLYGAPITVLSGDEQQLSQLLETKFDLIFYTGGPAFAHEVMAKAALHLTPVVLELGGKSPVVVTPEANLKEAAVRIVFGKFSNAGQTCVAPDYVFVHNSVKQELLDSMRCAVEQLYSGNAKGGEHYGRMITSKAVERIASMLSQTSGTIVYGGECCVHERYVSPTIVADVIVNEPLMQEEIFGPVLPVMGYDNIQEVEGFITSREKPLALYYFGDLHSGKKFVKRVPCGGACINDTLLHVANINLPFGGVGNSGMGNYHGEAGFKTFSHEKSVLCSRKSFEFKLKYPPYKWFSLIKRFL